MLLDRDRDALNRAIPPAKPDRRDGKRHATVLLIGKVRQGDRETACLVHDISTSGLMARFTHAPSVGDPLVIEVRGLPPVDATLRWIDGYRGGVEFALQQDLARVFCLRDDAGIVARTPRFEVGATVAVKLGDVRGHATLLDLSPGGAKLVLEMPVACGQGLTVHLPDLSDPVLGTVCWMRDGRAGLRFATPLSLATLSRVLGC